MTKKKRYGKTEENGRRTVDYFELIPELEKAQKEMNFKTFSEFARQIARDFLQNRPNMM